LDVVLVERHKVYYREGSGASHVKFMLEVARIKSAIPFSFNLH
jgi:hypothetical protein